MKSTIFSIENACISDVYWMVNTDRFHQEFRDELILSAVERKINSSASEVMKHILHQMYLRTKPWEPSSNPIPFVEIRQLVEKESSNLELIKYLDQYVSIISEFFNPLILIIPVTK